jgi:Amt family ammonium transporter
LFSTAAVNAAGFDGLFYGNPMQFLKQLLGVAVVWAFSFGVTWVIGKVLLKTIGLRVSPMEETIGLDISQHGERAYGGMLR